MLNFQYYRVWRAYGLAINDFFRRKMEAFLTPLNLIWLKSLMIFELTKGKRGNDHSLKTSTDFISVSVWNVFLLQFLHGIRVELADELTLISMKQKKLFTVLGIVFAFLAGGLVCLGHIQFMVTGKNKSTGATVNIGCWLLCSKADKSADTKCVAFRSMSHQGWSIPPSLL